MLSSVTLLSASEPAGDLSVDVSVSASCQILEAYDSDFVDVQPMFPGGDREMIRFINNERRYPARAYRDGVQGRVMCSFIVNPDGSLSHISVVRGISEELDREAVRVISEMPAWTPGKVGEKRVPVFCFLTIPFRK